MNKVVPGLILINALLWIGCVTRDATNPALKKISGNTAKADLDIFSAILKKAHPSLNLYLPKQQLKFLLDSIKSSIPESINIVDFYNKITFVVNELGCSHTMVEMHNDVYDTLQNRKFFFPYPVKWIDDKLLVNVVGHELPQGTEIRYINNDPVKKIIQNLMLYNSVDGFHRKTQQNIAGDNFSLEYFFKYGRQEKFELQIKDTTGLERKVIENAINLSEWNYRDDNYKYYYDPIEVAYDLTINAEKKYAYLRLSTFEFKGTQKQNAYENFCLNSFELLKNKKDIQSLIIDLRENRGGELYNAFLLYSYLSNEPFAEFEKVISKIKAIPYAEYLDADFIQFSEEKVNERLKDEFSVRLNNNFYSLPDSLIGNWQPDKFHYTGNVYLITNSAVVSAASYFAVMIKNAGRGKVIGEETEGGAYSGNGFTTLKYVLPSSKISFSFPYAHMIYSFKEKKNSGHGLMPDYDIPDSQESFKKNTDRQFWFVLDSLILNNK